MMRFGVLTHALRVPIKDAPEAAARAGFDGLEWSVRGEPPDDPFWSADVRSAVAHRAADVGVTIASIHLHTGSHPDFPEDAAGRNREKYIVLEAIDRAAALGAGVVVLPSFVQRLLATPAEHIQRAVQDLRAWAPAASAAGVTIGIEDVLTAEQNVALIDAIGSPAVKIYYDLGNSLRFGLDPYAGAQLLGHRICQHHMKDASVNPPLDAHGVPAYVPVRLGEGTADFPRFLRVLLRRKFEGWLVIETQSLIEDATSWAADNLHRLRGLLDQAREAEARPGM